MGEGIGEGRREGMSKNRGRVKGRERREKKSRHPSSHTCVGEALGDKLFTFVLARKLSHVTPSLGCGQALLTQPALCTAPFPLSLSPPT